MKASKVILVRGGGDLASGVIHRLYSCGYRVVILESAAPSAIRRKVSFCEAVYQGEASVEGVACKRIAEEQECEAVWQERKIPLLVDPEGASIERISPAAVVDGILAKKNLGTSCGMAPVTIALGPGFEAGKDADYVVETMRGHDLGRILNKGSAFPNTGIPGMVGGYSKERVIHAPAAGIIHNQAEIADLVEQGEILAYVDQVPVTASISGVLRGIIRDGYSVFQGMKIADIDPRKEQVENCFKISDKARCISGSVIEILLSEGVLP